jgi:hypothetical protein
VTDDTRPTDPFRPVSPPPAGDSNPFAAAPAPSGFDQPVVPATPVTVPTAPRRSSAGLFVNVLLGVALVVAVGGVAFAAGRATAPTTNTNGRFGANGGPGFAVGPNASGAPNRGTFGGAFGGAGVTIQGTVTAVSANSITLQVASGQTITIPTSSSTTYHSQTAATASDVTTGATVKVELGSGRLGGGGQNGGNGNGNGGQNGPAASGAPTRGFGGSASSITVVPAGG